MSIIRLTSIKEQLSAPDSNGNYINTSYNRRKKSGVFENTKITSNRSDLKHYLKARLSELNLDTSTYNKDIFLMVHGFLFNPKEMTDDQLDGSDNPHSRLYMFGEIDNELEIKTHASSWPKTLGLSESSVDNGLAIAYGWLSSPGLASSLLKFGKNHYVRAYEYAQRSAEGAAISLYEIHKMIPNSKIKIFCHSLGSKLVVETINHILDNIQTPGWKSLLDQIEIVLFMGGAIRVVEAQQMFRRIGLVYDDYHEAPNFFNLASRENDVLDVLGENFGPATRHGNTNVIGHNGLSADTKDSTWMDLQVDSKKLQKWMEEQKGIEISGDRPYNIWDHWYYYTHEGNKKLLNELIRSRAGWTQAELREAKIHEGVARGWFDRWTND